MCGIFCTIIYNKNTFLNEIAKKGDFKQTNSQFSEFCKPFLNRGPDHYKEFVVDVSSQTIIQFAGSVLWTQGSKPMPQPICTDNGNVLLWNGDIFSGPLATSENDTQALYDKLQDTVQQGLNVLDVFASIKGPYSFIYYVKASKKLYFGRDLIGRHSLLIGFTQRLITISSVASRKAEGFVEVPAVGIYSFDLGTDGQTSLTLHPWSHLSENISDLSYLIPKETRENVSYGEIIKAYIQPIRRNQKTPVASDLEMWTIHSQDYSIGSFMNRLSLIDPKMRVKNTMAALIRKESVQILVEDLLITLKEAVRLRIEKQPKLCKTCVKELIETPEKNINCNHSKVAILFSGGLDSAVLASLVHEFLHSEEPIDLLNVAFEKKQSPVEVSESQNRFNKKDKPKEVTFEVPDRITGLDTLNELKTIHPNRKWNFTMINVTQEELKKERENVIANLIYPLNTVLDESLGCALWFASRGRGILLETGEPYTSPSRIIISGIGADEQLGGYMRHRNTLKNKGGWEALDKELQHELRRISQRNLGRDDRIVSDHGRQLRMPYLDEDVINFLNFQPPWYRCNPIESMPPGLGDKLLLRLAAWKLGFRDTANFPKRAMQFGSRIANKEERGSDISERL